MVFSSAYPTAWLDVNTVVSIVGPLFMTDFSYTSRHCVVYYMGACGSTGHLHLAYIVAFKIMGWYSVA